MTAKKRMHAAGTNNSYAVTMISIMIIIILVLQGTAARGKFCCPALAWAQRSAGSHSHERDIARKLKHCPWTKGSAFCT